MSTRKDGIGDGGETKDSPQTPEQQHDLGKTTPDTGTLKQRIEAAWRGGKLGTAERLGFERVCAAAAVPLPDDEDNDDLEQRMLSLEQTVARHEVEIEELRNNIRYLMVGSFIGEAARAWRVARGAWCSRVYSCSRSGVGKVTRTVGTYAVE